MSETREDAGDDMLGLVDLKALGEGSFSGPPAPTNPIVPRVFGGLLLAQGLAAASFTVPEDAECHSLHAYFARPGIPARPIDYEVSAMRDGQSFILRSVAAVQRDELVCHLSASFGRDQAGPEFQLQMPDVPPPESYPPEKERAARMLERADARVRAMLSAQRGPVEPIQIDAMNFDDRTPNPNPVRMWIRLRKPLQRDPRLHRCAVAYASDMGLLAPSVRAIGGRFGDPELQVASLDHALWFHRPFFWDDWLLFVAETCSVAGGRGLSRGSIFTRAGQHIASIAQEGVMRKRDPLAERS